jgi:hypothetical protein
MVYALMVAVGIAAAPAWAFDLPPSQDVNDKGNASNANFDAKPGIRIKDGVNGNRGYLQN